MGFSTGDDLFNLFNLFGRFLHISIYVVYAGLLGSWNTCTSTGHEPPKKNNGLLHF